MNMKIEILTLIIRLGILFVSGFLAPALKAWLESKAEDARIERLKGYARQAVEAAEQIHKKAQKDDPDGEKRRKFAREALNRMGYKMGLALSQDEIDALIEAAVWQLNRESRAITGPEQ